MKWALLACSLLVVSAAHAVTIYVPNHSSNAPLGCPNGSCLSLDQFNSGSLQIITPIASRVGNGFGYNVFPPMNEIAARERLSSGNDADLLSLVLQYEAGGTNLQSGKTQGRILKGYLSAGASGEVYALDIESRKLGDGDNNGFQIKAISTGTTSAGGDEGLIGYRADVRDFANTPVGTVTFAGGSVETVIPTGISEFEWDNVGDGNLIVWTDGQTTGRNITNYTAGTRTWTYDGAHIAGLTGRCMAVTSHDYTDETSTSRHVWIFIDSADAVANTFTTQIRQVNDGVVGAGQHYTAGSQTSPVVFAKACNRIAAFNRDPNGDGDYADGTLTLVGGNWPNNVLDITSANPTVGSCASNCTFEIAGDIIGKLKGASLIVTNRRDTLEENYAMRISTGASGIASEAAIQFHNGSGNLYGFDHGIHCDRSVSNGCVYHETAVNDAANEAVIRADIVNNSGTAGFLPIVRIYENVSGGLGPVPELNLNADVSGSTKVLSLGASGSERAVVTAPHTPCSNNQVLAYDNSGDLNRGWVCATNAAMIGAPVVNIAGFQVPIPWTYAVTGVASTLATLWVQGHWSRRRA